MSIKDVPSRFGLLTSLFLIYSLLLIPIAVIIMTSFTPQSNPTLPHGDLSLKWYGSLINNSDIIDALWNSALVAVLTTIISGSLGTITAFGFVRSEIRYKNIISLVVLIPMMIPPIILGLALARFAGFLGFGSGFLAVLLAHSVFTFPYVFLIVRARLVTFDRSLEKASMVLGAGPVESAVNITLPIISPAIISSMFVAFIVSFGEFTATQLLVSPDTTTVPVIIYTMTRSGLTPEISALSTILVILMLAVAAASTLVGD